jgi:hypothetical protein
MSTGPSAHLSRGRVRARSFLRTARLNVVGYAALIGACLVAAVGSASALRTTGWPPVLRAAVGPVVVVLVLVAADRRKWSRMETSFSFTDDPAELRTVADRLLAQGLPVRVEEDQGPAITYRHRDARRVHAALRQLGITTW